MQRPRRVQVKLCFKKGGDVSPADFVPVFHRWIQRAAVDELLIDIHNYAHIHQGAGILLVGHEGDYAIDLRGGRSGLLYTLKRGAFESLSEAVRVALLRTLRGGRLLEEDHSLRGRIEVDTADFDLTIPDRLGYPNSPETFAEIEEELSSVIRQVSRGAAVSLARIDNDARESLTIRATMPAAPPLTVLAAAEEVADV